MQHVEPYSTPTRLPRMPEDALWINEAVLTDHKGLQDRLLLFDFWDYTCINCLRTLPYLREWHHRYQHLDFLLIGIHTPEFPFAKEPENVQRAVQRLGISWPVALDNDHAIWTAFANRYWPTKYLCDREGYLRYRHAGEGGYREFETALQELLNEGETELELPEIMSSVRPEDEPGSVCRPTTPELQADSLGNPASLDTLQPPHPYSLPESVEPGKFYLEGDWTSVPFGHRMQSKQGRIVLEYQAARCNAVLGCEPEPPHEHVPVRIRQDGQPLPERYFGQDILQSEGHTMLRINYPRLYALVDAPAVERHRLSLEITAPGLTFYSFSFESCASIQKDPQFNSEV
jgi:thiol-disulfide isomerase/thioredoxin